jgi:hypothetical protein
MDAVGSSPSHLRPDRYVLRSTRAFYAQNNGCQCAPITNIGKHPSWARRRRTPVRERSNNVKKAKPAQWTVMLYMAATVDDYPDIDARTERAALDDIRELEKVGTVDGTVNVVVQINRRWPAYAQRYCVRKGWSEPLGSFPENSKVERFFKSPNPKVFGRLYSKSSRAAAELRGVDHSDSTALQGFLQRFLGTGNGNVLRDFVEWTQKWYPADHSLLVLWGHAYGLGFGRDHHDPLTLPEIAGALKSSTVDILGANACAMSYAEAAYELRKSADYLVASEIAMPFKGWPYERILTEIVNNPEIEARELSGRIVDDFMDSYRYKGVALTALDLGRADGLKEKIDALARKLELAIKAETSKEHSANSRQPSGTHKEPLTIPKVVRREMRRKGPANQLDDKVKQLADKISSAIRERRALTAMGVGSIARPSSKDATNGPGTEISLVEFERAVRDRNRKQIGDAFLDTAYGDNNRPLIDLCDLCQILKSSRDEAVRDAAEELADFPQASGLIVKREAGSDLDHLNGLGIFAPAVTTLASRELLELDRQSYDELQLGKDNVWKRFVYGDLRSLLDDRADEVADFVRDTGAADREAQVTIGYLTSSVFRAFDRLAEALESTRLTVMPVLSGAPREDVLNEIKHLSVKTNSPVVTAKPHNESHVTEMVKTAAQLELLEDADVDAILADTVVTGIPYALSAAARQRLDARLAPPFLKLGSTAAPAASAAGGGSPDPRLGERFDNIVTSLQDFERALANAEQTVMRALTHAEYGVGGPAKGSISEGGPPKGSISEGGPPKGSISEGGPPKGSISEGAYPPLILASGIDIGEIRGAGELKNVFALYMQVALPLQQLETSAAKLETVLRTVLTDPAVSIDPTNDTERKQYRQYVVEQVEQSFREFDYSLTDATRTTIGVMTHPVFGLGPGPEPGLGAATRQRLAVAAGLSSRVLQLL